MQPLKERNSASITDDAVPVRGELPGSRNDELETTLEHAIREHRSPNPTSNPFD